MNTLLKRFGGIAALSILFLAAAWLLPLTAAERSGDVVPAVWETESPPAALRPADAAPLSNVESVLLLRNGEMVQGRVRRLEDRYEVQVSGGEIFVKAADVQHQCRDVQEVYLRKTALIRRDNTMDHLDLAQWCMKVGLLEPASRELGEAAALDPQHPLIPVLERRLKVLSAPAPKSGPGGKSVPAGPTQQELDRMVRGMPPKTVETFSQVIQPMLVNSCSAAACHGPSVQNGFRLLRMPTDSPPSRLLTQRNLHAALQWLDRERPEASPLLTYATQAHGAARVPVFTDKQVIQFRQLRDWCNRVVKADNATVQASYYEPAGSSDQGRGGRSSTGTTRGARRPHANSGTDRAQKPWPSSAWDSGTVDLRNSATPEASQRSGHFGGPGPRSSATEDPFDPESFNRQYAPRNQAQNGAKDSRPSTTRGGQSSCAPRDPRAPAEASPAPGAHADE